MKARNYRLAKPSETKCPDCVHSFKLSARGGLECPVADSQVGRKHTCDHAQLLYEQDDEDADAEEQMRANNSEFRMENERDLAIEDGF